MSRRAGAAGALRGAARWLSRTLVEPRLPLLAVEVRPRAVAAVRLTEQRGQLSLAAAASTELPQGVLEVSLTKPNVLEPASFQAALRATLERVGALSGGVLGLVLPDPALRVTLVPGAALRARRRDADETVRFLLHKALPFDVRGARLSWRLVGEQALVAVAREDVLAGYEEAVEALGFQAGLVEPSSLALAASAVRRGPSGDVLLVNWDEGYVSFLLVRDGEPLLVRTLPGEASADAVARQAATTLQFHRDRMAGAEISQVVLRSAALPGDQAAALLERAVGIAPKLVQPWAALGIAEEGDAAQAVAGAAACALRRAA